MKHTYFIYNIKNIIFAFSVRFWGSKQREYGAATLVKNNMSRKNVDNEEHINCQKYGML